MRRALTLTLTLTGLAAIAVAAAGRTVAQPAAAPPGTPQAAGFTQLFISPAGEPYRAKAGEPYPVALWFKQADANHDGVITREEFRADHAGFFYALDNDDAGYLDGGKLAFYERRLLPDVYLASIGALTPGWAPGGPARIEPASEIVGQDDAQLIRVQGANVLGGNVNSNQNNGLGGAQGPISGLNAQRAPKKEYPAAAFYGLLGEPEPVRGADTNLDGRVTKEEFLAAADRRFKLLDKRQDGKLTLDELPATPAQLAMARNSRR